jgi:hypothetical protein
MCNRCIKVITVLAVLVLSLISVSSAAGLRAMPDLYKGQCGAELTLPAPGILKNDVKSSGQMQVIEPEKISVDPKYGTLTVNEDGSFVYDAAQYIAQGTYVTFNYRVTDGSKKISSALVKIQITCVCRGTAPDVTVCPSTKITSDLLLSEGAKCTGCRDVTPKFDLRKMPANPVAGACFPYTVSCSGSGPVMGHVCFEGCAITSAPFTILPHVIPTAEQILRDGGVACNCDTDPVISNIHELQDHWEYTTTCRSECGSVTGTGIVNVDHSCDVVEPVVFPIFDCPAALPAPDQVISLSGLSCGCDTTPVITDIKWVSQPENDIWTGEYIYTCTSWDGSTSSGIGQFETASDCYHQTSVISPTAQNS